MTVRRFCRNELVFTSFSERAGVYASKACLQNNRANIRRWANIKSYLTSKLDPIPILSNYMATTQITRVFRTKPQVFTPFLRDTSRFFPPVSVNLLTNGAFFLFLFPPGIWGSLRPKYSNKTTQYLAKRNKTKKTPFGNGFTMAHSVKKKGVSPENGVNVRLLINLGFSS